MRRRELVRAAGALGVAGLAGCSGDGDETDDGTGDTDADGGTGGDGDEILVGPDGSLSFDPESLTVSTGTTVTWRFESASHNVSCVPDHADEASLPDGADSFASYEGDDRFATVPAGETFEHTFETAGTYDYVCVPHVTSEMTGTVVVE